jgi:serine/threonine-protein kinase RsbW
LTIRLTPRIDAISGMLGRLETYAEAMELPPRAAHRLAVVCEELAANVAMHAGPSVTYVQVAVDRDGNDLHLCVEDDGPAFDPLTVAPPNTAAALGDRNVGGLGIHFVRKMVKNLAYERSGQVNRLTAVLGTAE